MVFLKNMLLHVALLGKRAKNLALCLKKSHLFLNGKSQSIRTLIKIDPSIDRVPIKGRVLSSLSKDGRQKQIPVLSGLRWVPLVVIDTSVAFSTVNIQSQHFIYDSFLLDSKFVFFKKRVKVPLYFKRKHEFILVFQWNHWTETIYKIKEGFKKRVVLNKAVKEDHP